MSFLTSNILAIGLLLIGVILCFAGYRTLKKLVWMIGFLVGLVLTASISFAWFEFSQLAALAIGLIGGLVGAVLIGFLYFAGVFTVGAVFGASLGGLVASEMNMDPTAFVGLIAVVGGCSALAFQKLILVFSTAGVGTWFLLAGITSFVGYASPFLFLVDPFTWWASLRIHEWLVFLGALLFIAGIITQWTHHPHRKEEDEEKEKS